MIAISAESSVISASLTHMQALLLSKQNADQLFHSRPEIAAAFNTCLTGCMVLFSCLDEDICKVVKHAKEDGILSPKGKFEALWKQDRIQELLNGIRGQRLAISTLIQLLQMSVALYV